MGFPYKHCYFKTRLPTCQNGVENCDKAYYYRRGQTMFGAPFWWPTGAGHLCIYISTSCPIQMGFHLVYKNPVRRLLSQIMLFLVHATVELNEM